MLSKIFFFMSEKPDIFMPYANNYKKWGKWTLLLYSHHSFVSEDRGNWKSHGSELLALKTAYEHGHQCACSLLKWKS